MTAAAEGRNASPLAKLLEQYGWADPVHRDGRCAVRAAPAVRQRVDPPAIGARERYEALARSVRDLLSQRWLRTQQTYDRENPKRVYYLSMEFLIGRSLANNIINLLLDPVPERIVDDRKLDWIGLLEEEPDAGLGNGGLGRLAACFLDSMATMQLPAMGYGLRYEYGIFRQSIENGWQREQPDNWLRRPDPWEVARPQETVEITLGCSFEVHEGTLRAIVGRPSTLIGIPYDRPVVGYGGRDDQHPAAVGRGRARLSSTSRRSAPATSSAPWPSGLRPNRSLGFSIPTTRRPWDRGCASCRSTSWSPARWPISCAASARTMPTGARCPTRSPSSSTTPIPAWPSRS